ncbi:SPOSA6832_00949, partial [Sporobolomyces salmonicolor]
MSTKKHNSGSTKSGDTKPPSSARKIAITAAEGYTGSAVIELLLTDGNYKGKFSSLVGLTFGADGASEGSGVLSELGVETVDVLDADEAALEKTLKDLGIDTLLLVPPARKDKTKLVKKVLSAGKATKSVQNVVFLSSAGADYAERDRQPRLREFIDLEGKGIVQVLAMQPKSDPSTGDTGHSPCVVRAGFYLENLLLYSKQAQGEGKLPLPIDPDHKFAPVALGDVALLLATILTSTGPHGLADSVRGQMIVLTGPMMTAGPELAEAASQALGTKLEFESISEKEAQKILEGEAGEAVDQDVSTAAFKQITGQDAQQPTEFFEAYAGEFKKKRRRVSKADDDE